MKQNKIQGTRKLHSELDPATQARRIINMKILGRKSGNVAEQDFTVLPIIILMLFCYEILVFYVHGNLLGHTRS